MASRIARIALALAALVVLAGCGDSADSADDPGVDPSGREWVLQELGGEPVMDEPTIDLTIADDQVTGSAGCNQYVGTADFGDGTLVIEPEVAQTMMACPDDVTAQEQAYLETLMTVTGWSATEDELQLLDADDTVVARFG